MYIGIDVGGTNLKTGILNDKNELVYQFSQSTNAAKGLDYVLTNIKRVITILLEKYPACKSIGVGVPGSIKSDGTVQISPNLPGWTDIPLGRFLNNLFSLPIVIDNDAHTAAIAEMKLGAGKDKKHFIYVTLGTGVGGAIVINRSIYRGEFMSAGEIGHVIIDAHAELNKGNPYRTGVLEEFIGRNQITSYARRVLVRYPDSLLHKYDRPDPYFVSQAAAKNDEAAIEIFTVIGTYLGIGLATAMNLLDIGTIIIGGGISTAHPLLLETALQTIKQRAMPPIAAKAEILQAMFTKDSGVIGAALAGKELYETK